MKEIIKAAISAISAIEQGRGIKVIYAAEAGSRAWGFPSIDSDYDIRLIYVRSLTSILKVRQESDNFEHKIIYQTNHTVIDNGFVDYDKAILDMAGWELPKALGLLTKSNSPLLEWLESPIVYMGEGAIREELLQLALQFVDPKAMILHYGNMASRCLSEHLMVPQIKLKKYFYAIRPILAGMYVHMTGNVPPVDFLTLFKFKQFKLPDNIYNKIENLYVRKLNSTSESQIEQADIELIDWIQAKITSLRSLTPKISSKKVLQESCDTLDAFLYRMVIDNDREQIVGIPARGTG